jgi:hypothetical protein
VLVQRADSHLCGDQAVRDRPARVRADGGDLVQVPSRSWNIATTSSPAATGRAADVDLPPAALDGDHAKVI